MSKSLLIFLGIATTLVAIFFYMVIKLVKIYEEEEKNERH